MWHRRILLAAVILCACSSLPSPITDAGIDASSEAAPTSRFCDDSTTHAITGVTPASYAEVELFPYDPVQATTTEIRFDDVVIDVQ